ncbi:MAG: hypothetical protein R6X19_05010 [Kiritimatiellia bacterium]
MAGSAPPFPKCPSCSSFVTPSPPRSPSSSWNGSCRYLTNPIARASAVMAECSALAKGELRAAAE